MEKGEDFLHLPPGFGFHPSDEELIVHYLFNKVKLGSIPASVIAEIELYNYNPWELPRRASFGKDEWYFFSPRDRKYPKGSRPKRSAGSGFWKATGKDKQIYSSSGSKIIGVKKALAFFSGNPTKCYKTNWTMSEYRLPESSTQSTRLNGSMRLDDWVLCRIRQKGNKSKNVSQLQENPKNKLSEVHFPTIEQELPSSYMVTKSSMDIISDRRSIEFQLMASILAGQDLSPIIERCSPKLFQGDNNGLGDEGAFYKESAPVMLDGDTVEHNEVFSRDVWASNDPFNVLAENHKDGSII